MSNNEKYYINFKKYSKEEINEIHERNELTLDEKVDEYYSYDICPNGEHGIANCHSDMDCKNCIKRSLMDTKQRSFPKMTLCLRKTNSEIINKLF